MGNIMAPAYNVLWENLKKDSELDAERIKLWVRYIDDIFVVWQGPQTDFEHFVQQCNKLHPTIKFTSECSETEINFLDMTIYKGTRFQDRHMLDNKTNQHTSICPWIIIPSERYWKEHRTRRSIQSSPNKHGQNKLPPTDPQSAKRSPIKRVQRKGH